MRINLITPFAEKDAAKALGARWDAAKKCWYIVDVDDLTPFMRWIPNLAAAQDTGAAAPKSLPTAASRAKPSVSTFKPTHGSAAANGNAHAVPHCGCQVLPWEPCEHSPD